MVGSESRYQAFLAAREPEGLLRCLSEVAARDAARQGAYRWVREHTPPEAAFLPTKSIRAIAESLAAGERFSRQQGVAVWQIVEAIPAWRQARPAVRTPGARQTSAAGGGVSLGRLGAAYFLEGLGYIVSGTFAVAAVQRRPELVAWAPWVWVAAGVACVAGATGAGGVLPRALMLPLSTERYTVLGPVPSRVYAESTFNRETQDGSLVANIILRSSDGRAVTELAVVASMKAARASTVKTLTRDPFGNAPSGGESIPLTYASKKQDKTVSDKYPNLAEYAALVMRVAPILEEVSRDVSIYDW